MQPIVSSLPFLTTTPLLLLLLLSFCFHNTHASLVVAVAHRDEMCFMIRTPKGPEKSIVTGTFDLLDDTYRPHPVKIVILNDKLEQLFESKYATKSGDFSVIAPLGQRLSLCVRNNMDSKATIDRYIRTVGLDVNVKTMDVSSALASTIQDVNTRLWNAKTTLDYMRTRESMHREVKEQTFTRMLVWSIVEAVCVIGTSLIQIWYMRRFVEKRGRY